MPKVKVIELEDGSVVFETTSEEYTPFKPDDPNCTCTDCPLKDRCAYAYDPYNTDGDCLLGK